MSNPVKRNDSTEWVEFENKIEQWRVLNPNRPLEKELWEEAWKPGLLMIEKIKWLEEMGLSRMKPRNSSEWSVHAEEEVIQAIKSKNKVRLNWLLDRQIDVNTVLKTQANSTPLILCAQEGWIQGFGLLLKAGQPVYLNIKNTKGLNAPMAVANRLLKKIEELKDQRGHRGIKKRKVHQCFRQNNAIIELILRHQQQLYVQGSLEKNKKFQWSLVNKYHLNMLSILYLIHHADVEIQKKNLMLIEKVLKIIEQEKRWSMSDVQQAIKKSHIMYLAPLIEAWELSSQEYKELESGQSEHPMAALSYRSWNCLKKEEDSFNQCLWSLSLKNLPLWISENKERADSEWVHVAEKMTWMKVMEPFWDRWVNPMNTEERCNKSRHSGLSVLERFKKSKIARHQKEWFNQKLEEWIREDEVRKFNEILGKSNESSSQNLKGKPLRL